jgi:citrate lyase subunit beta/citryl-CoA lyase
MSTSPVLARSFAMVGPCMAPYLAQSRDWPADILCLDLEDSTPPTRKIEARDIIRDYLAVGRPRARSVLVRINGLSTPWGVSDLEFVRDLDADGVLLPKVDGAAIVRQAREILGAKALWCLIETPLGVLRAEEIAAAGVAGLVVGASDLSAGLGTRQTTDRLPLLHALSRVVLAARAYGILAIDSSHHDFVDMETIESSTRQSEELGFDGKLAFSAETVLLANRIFRPGDDDVRHAEAAIGGTGGYGGHIDHARAVLERARLAELADRDD